jgi:hypothetical protein
MASMTSPTVGNNGTDAPQTFNCPIGSFITSMGTTTGNDTGIHALQVTCNDAAATTKKICVNNGCGAVSQTDTSAVGYTGVNLWSAKWVNAIQGVLPSGGLGKRLGLSSGGAQNPPFRCPSGMVFTGFSGNTAFESADEFSVVANLNVSCNYPVDCSAIANAFHPSCVSWCTANSGICLVNRKANCSGVNLNSNDCNTFCNVAGDPCAANLTAFCAGSEAQLAAYPNLCGCHMGDNYYSKFFATLATAAIGAVPPFPYCYFGKCAGGAIQTATVKQPCPSLTICTTNLTVQNQGVINGAINIAQSNSCGAGTSTGASTDTGTGTNTSTGTGTETAESDVIFSFQGVDVTLKTAALAGGVVIVLLVGLLVILPGKSSKNKKKKRNLLV